MPVTAFQSLILLIHIASYTKQRRSITYGLTLRAQHVTLYSLTNHKHTNPTHITPPIRSTAALAFSPKSLVRLSFTQQLNPIHSTSLIRSTGVLAFSPNNVVRRFHCSEQLNPMLHSALLIYR